MEALPRVALYSLSIGLLLAAALGGRPALAQDASVRATITDRLQYDDNPLLVEDPIGYVVGNTLSADVVAENRGPRVGVGLNVGAAHTEYWGDGDAVTPDATDWYTALIASNRGPRSTLNGRAEYRRQAVQQSELTDTGATAGNADRVTKSVGGTLGYALSGRDRLESTAGFRDVDFRGETDPGRNQHQAVDLGLTFFRALTPRDTVSYGVVATFLDADDAADTRSQAYTARASLENRRTPQLTTRMGAGLGVVRRTRDTFDPDIGRDTETDPTLTLNIGASYTLPRLVLSAGLEQGFQPSARGDLDVVRSITGDASYALREDTRLTFTVLQTSNYADAELLPIQDGYRHYLSLGPGMTWRFLPDWTFAAGYRFRHERGDDGKANGNQVFASVSYAWTIVR